MISGWPNVTRELSIISSPREWQPKRELENVQASDPSPGRAEVDSLVEAGIANVKQDLEDSRSGRMLKGLGTLCQRITRVHQGTGLNRPLL